ncbi:uncharacterized protein JCM6883_006613 [Sporobolomyces salmoneus]|uniref:uncharacterized protein n=1 Tax=Sporobolomyces salmoneus TaxID=183962 RepID=UPI00317D3ED8
MSNFSVPLLPPPPPRFPQTFGSTENSSFSDPTERGEPAEMDEVERRVDRAGKTKWNLKTEAEEHVQKLEDKLSQLSKRQSQASSSRELAEPDSAEGHHDFQEGVMDRENAEDAAEEGGEGFGHEDDTEDEGRALLPIAEASTEEGDLRTTDEEAENEADLSGNDDENRRIPHHPFENMTAAQRISFSNSVRISGGIHTRPHRHRPPLETFPRRSPSNERTTREARPETAPSPLLVASVTSSNINSPSRATSPSGRTPTPHSAASLNVLAPKPRRLSSSSHLSSTYSHSAYPYYSASPGSQIPSRGSSPCSSIYAPLQPPSRHTPNPLFVRPSARLQRQRSSGSSGLSFQEYLREGYDAFDASDDDDEDSDTFLPKSPGYRELVEQQRRKRFEWEQRKRRRIADKRKKLDRTEEESSKVGGFWSGLKKFFAVGMSLDTLGSGVGRARGSLGSPTAFRPNPNYGATQARSSTRTAPSPAPNAASASTLRSILTRAPLPPPSTIEPVPTSPDPPDPPDPPPSRSRPPRTRPKPPSISPPRPPLPRSPPDKSELDNRFGPSPLRYLSPLFLIYQLSAFLAAVQDLISTAKKGLEKQKERERLARQREQPQRNGYQAV